MIRKKFRTWACTALLLALCICCGAIVACSSGQTAQPANGGFGISPTSTNFIAGQSGDLILLLGEETQSLTLTADGENVAAENYTVEGDTLRIAEEFLASLSRGAHTFTADNGEEEKQFTVTCYAVAGVSPQAGEFKWDAPEDLVFTVDLGGAAFVSVELGEETLAASEFTFADNTLTLPHETIEMHCTDGANTFVLNTAVAATEFIVNCSHKNATPEFDTSVYKFQQSPGSDVRFRFVPYGQAFTVSAPGDNGEYAALAEGEYSTIGNYLVIESDYLDGLLCDFLPLRVTVDDSAKTSFDFTVVPYGKTDSAHAAVQNGNAVQNFDSLAAGSTYCEPVSENEVYSMRENTVIESADAVSGKSLAIKSAGTGVDTLFGVNIGFDTQTVYYIELQYKIITEGARPEVVFKWSGSAEHNFLWVLSDNTINAGNTDDGNTAQYDASTGVTTVRAYVTPSAGDNRFEILTIGQQSAFTLVLDNIRILSTSIPVNTTYSPVSEYDYNILSGYDLTVNTLCTGSYRLVSIVCGEETLEAGTDYTTASGGMAVISASWLAGHTEDFTLTLTRSYVSDEIGTRQTQQAVVSVSVFDKNPASIDDETYKSQTSEREALTFEITLGDYTIESVSLGKQVLDVEEYTFAEGILTIKADTLNGLYAGIHAGEIALKAADGTVDALAFSVGVYGDAEGNHLADGIGAQNFDNFAAGSKMTDIWDGSRVTSMTSAQDIQVVEDGSSGKALHIPFSAAGTGSIQFKGMEANTMYYIKMVFRTEDEQPVKNLLWKWLYANNKVGLDASWIENGAIKSNCADVRNTLTQDEYGVYTWESYIKPSDAANDELFLWVVTQQGLFIDSLEVIRLNNFTAIGEYGTYVPYRYADVSGGWTDSGTVTFASADAELKIVENINVPAAMTFGGLYAGDDLLEAGTDYRRDGDSLVLLPSYLATISDSVTLTLRRTAPTVTGVDFVQTAAVTVTASAASA